MLKNESKIPNTGNEKKKKRENFMPDSFFIYVRPIKKDKAYF